MIRFPAEWEKQDCIIISFPHKNSDWSDNLKSALSVFVRIASSICYNQKVILICDDIEKTKNLFCYHEKISFVKLETNDTWIRDYGPISIYDDNKKKLINFKFNAWGNKYPFNLDQQITKLLHKKWHFGISQLIESDIVLEGGAIETDGYGTLLATLSSIVNKNRNPLLTQKDIESKLKSILGINKFLWLNHGKLIGDDTDGHIDTLARFVNKDTIVYVTCEREDEHFTELSKMKDELKSFNTIDGKPYNLIPLPLPSAKFKNGKRLPATYANFLITNSSVLLPTYDDPLDKEMIFLFKRLFPNREIIPINSLRLIEEGGSIHCSTMNVAF